MERQFESSKHTETQRNTPVCFTCFCQLALLHAMTGWPCFTQSIPDVMYFETSHASTSIHTRINMKQFAQSSRRSKPSPRASREKNCARQSHRREKLLRGVFDAMSCQARFLAFLMGGSWFPYGSRTVPMPFPYGSHPVPMRFP